MVERITYFLSLITLYYKYIHFYLCIHGLVYLSIYCCLHNSNIFHITITHICPSHKTHNLKSSSQTFIPLTLHCMDNVMEENGTSIHIFKTTVTLLLRAVMSRTNI